MYRHRGTFVAAILLALAAIQPIGAIQPPSHLWQFEEGVDGTGCSISQFCPASATWRNHGQYVSCVAQTSTRFENAGFISAEQRKQLVTAAAHSNVGK